MAVRKEPDREMITDATSSAWIGMQDHLRWDSRRMGGAGKSAPCGKYGTPGPTRRDLRLSGDPPCRRAVLPAEGYVPHFHPRFAGRSVDRSIATMPDGRPPWA